jgi:hypothetical protein
MMEVRQLHPSYLWRESKWQCQYLLYMRKVCQASVTYNDIKTWLMLKVDGSGNVASWLVKNAFVWNFDSHTSNFCVLFRQSHVRIPCVSATLTVKSSFCSSHFRLHKSSASLDHTVFIRIHKTNELWESRLCQSVPMFLIPFYLTDFD